MSVEKLRQTNSLSAASANAKIPQRHVSLRQPASFSSKASAKTVLDEKPVEGEPAQQQRAEERVENRRLHFDENVVLQIKRQPAEHQNEHRREQRHGRKLALVA